MRYQAGRVFAGIEVCFCDRYDLFLIDKSALFFFFFCCSMLLLLTTMLTKFVRTAHSDSVGNCARSRLIFESIMYYTGTANTSITAV